MKWAPIFFEPGEQPAGKQAWRIIAIAAGLLLIWRLLLGITGWRAEYAESNYHQNLLRLEGFQQQMAGESPPADVLAGTSVTGRLLPQFFDQTPLQGIANLGLDGTSPAFALEQIHQLKRVPKRVFLETYVLHKPQASNEILVLESLNSPAGRMARFDPLFRTESRPSTLLYSTLKRGREAASTGKLAVGPPSHPLNPPDAVSLKRLIQVITQLQARSCEIILVDLPVGTDWPPGATLGEPVASELIRQLGIRRVDTREMLLRRGVDLRFTDGIHLDGASAKKTAQALGDLVAVTTGP